MPKAGGKSTRRLAIGKRSVKGGEVRRGDAARSGDHIAEKSRHCRRGGCRTIKIHTPNRHSGMHLSRDPLFMILCYYCVYDLIEPKTLDSRLKHSGTTGGGNWGRSRVMTTQLLMLQTEAYLHTLR